MIDRAHPDDRAPVDRSTGAAPAPVDDRSGRLLGDEVQEGVALSDLETPGGEVECRRPDHGC